MQDAILVECHMEVRALDYQRWTITFPSGSFSGGSATEALRALSKSQWTQDDRENVKRALAWRTYVLTGEMVSELDDDETFLRTICALGMAELEVESNGSTEHVRRTD